MPNQSFLDTTTSEVGGVSPTGKSISVSFALRACVRAKLRVRV